MKTQVITKARLRAAYDQAPVDLFSKAYEDRGNRAPRRWKMFTRKDWTDIAITEHRFAMRCQGWRFERQIPAGGSA
jgi:hypothetical protein